jgi:hypothetical protein
MILLSELSFTLVKLLHETLTVLACGSPQFEYRARKAVRDSHRDIRFLNGEYQPDETVTSKLSVIRFNTKIHK